MDQVQKRTHCVIHACQCYKSSYSTYMEIIVRMILCESYYYCTVLCETNENVRIQFQIPRGRALHLAGQRRAGFPGRVVGRPHGGQEDQPLSTRQGGGGKCNGQSIFIARSLISVLSFPC